MSTEAQRTVTGDEAASGEVPRGPHRRVREQAGPSARVGSLDGLRGVAALVVVVQHILLSFGWLSDPYASLASPDNAPWFERVLTYSPLHLLWLGNEAVFVFFVLSGYVLARTDLSSAGRTAGYAAKRFVRLYLPVAAAVAIAGVERVVVARSASASSGWLSWHAGNVSFADHFRAAGLVVGDGGLQLDSVLWSLKWEVLFSLILPVAIAVLALAGRRLWTVIAGLAACVFLSVWVSDGLLLYMPMFLLGTLLALHRERFAHWFRRAASSWSLGVLGLLMVTARWTINPPTLLATYRSQQLLQGVDDVVVVAGACLLVLCAGHASGWRRVLERRTVQYVGRRSFSLYLVHEPIVVTVAQIFRPHAQPVLFVATSVALSLAAAEVFFTWVEQPATRLAGRAGRRASALTATAGG